MKAILTLVLLCGGGYLLFGWIASHMGLSGHAFDIGTTPVSYANVVAASVVALVLYCASKGK